MAKNNNMSRVFGLLHQACNGPRIKTAQVKDSFLTTEANCLQCWKEHFSLLLLHSSSPGYCSHMLFLPSEAAAVPTTGTCNQRSSTEEPWQPYLCSLSGSHSGGVGGKFWIYNSAILPFLLHGSETGPLNKTMAARIDGIDSRALWTIGNIRSPQRISNEVLETCTRQPKASCKAAQHRWFSHVLRLPPDHPRRAILQFDPKAAGWRRLWSRPCTRWLGIIAEDL